LFLAAFIAAALALVAPTSWTLGLLATVALLIPASEAAVDLLNFVMCRLLPPRVLPRMDFKDGIPADCLTFVVIPGMLTKPESARPLLGRLELHSLANPDRNFRFALLTDFADAPAEVMPDDEACLAAALAGVRALNEKHASAEVPRFFVLH